VKRVTVVQVGGPDPVLVPTIGDYDQWFVDALPGPSSVVRPFRGESLPPWTEVEAVLITGSPLSVRDDLPWMLETGRFGVQAMRAGLPVLAVCFGHQIVGEALGGWVDKNPAGPERGTVRVQLTAAGRQDPLFEGLGDEFSVQQSHGDYLARAPEGALRLAGNVNTRWQSYAIGSLRAVQFHPELRPDAARALFGHRGWDTCSIEDGDAGPAILANWSRHYL
jgi:GMP synthase (glutamine-hydrolysing)